METAKTNKIDRYEELTERNEGAPQQEVAEAEVPYSEPAQEVRLRTERLIMHRKAVAMIIGLWKDRDGGPVDGVEYQNQHRAAW